MSGGFISINSQIDSLKDLDYVVRESFDFCFNAVTDVMEFDREKVEMLENIQNTLENMADLTRDISIFRMTCEEMQDKLQTQNLEAFTYEEIRTEFDNTKSVMNNKAGHDESQTAHITSLEETRSGLQRSDSGAEDDLLVTEETEHYKDPISKQRIVDPVKSKKCGHYFEKKHIYAYIIRNDKRCPHTGCPNIISENDLIEDIELKNKLANIR